MLHFAKNSAFSTLLENETNVSFKLHITCYKKIIVIDTNKGWFYVYKMHLELNDWNKTGIKMLKIRASWFHVLSQKLTFLENDGIFVTMMKLFLHKIKDCCDSCRNSFPLNFVLIVFYTKRIWMYKNMNISINNQHTRYAQNWQISLRSTGSLRSHSLASLVRWTEKWLRL